jgi:polyhydroxybutyrate depolymerase
VVGLSNGGMMAYRLAGAIPEKITAIVTVSASLTVDDFDMAKDVAVLHIHGTDDQFVPIAGGKGAKSISGVSYRPLADTIQRITKGRNCEAPQLRALAGGVQSSLYQCRSGAPVEVVLIQGGPHGWPGSRKYNAESSVRRNFSASRYAWEFLSGFRLTAK